MKVLASGGLTAADSGGVRTLAQLLDANVWARMMYSPFLNPYEVVTVALFRNGQPVSSTARLDFAQVRTPEKTPITGWFRHLVDIALKPLGITDPLTRPQPEGDGVWSGGVSGDDVG